MRYPSTCDFCGKVRFNFCGTGGVELYLDRTPGGDDVIVVDGIRPDCPGALSIPIGYCPFCGRGLKKED